MSEIKAVPRLTHRQRQALQTRQLIVQAATERFLQDGYGSATMEAIAAQAGVAVSTVYSAFTSKRGLLQAIRENWHQDSEQRELYQQASTKPDLAERLKLAAHATRRQWETGGQMIRVYTTAAAVDLEAAAELQEAMGGRRAALGQTIRRWAQEFGLDPEEAAASFLALTRAEVYQELVGEWGWTPQQYERWLADVLQSQFQHASVAD